MEAVSEQVWNPETFGKRIRALIARGVDGRLADELWWNGNTSLVSEVEHASDAEIAELNAAYSQRG